MVDLLSTAPRGGSSDGPMAVVDCPHGVYVKGLSIHTVGHEEDALHLLFEARQCKYHTSSDIFIGLAEGGGCKAGGGWPEHLERGSTLLVLFVVSRRTGNCSLLLQGKCPWHGYSGRSSWRDPGFSVHQSKSSDGGKMLGRVHRL